MSINPTLLKIPYQNLVDAINHKHTWFFITTNESEVVQKNANAEYIDRNEKGDVKYRIDKASGDLFPEDAKLKRPFFTRTVRNRIISGAEVAKAIGIKGRVYVSNEHLETLSEDPGQFVSDALADYNFLVNTDEVKSVECISINLYKVKFDDLKGYGNFYGELLLDTSFDDPIDRSNVPYLNTDIYNF